MAHEKDSRIKKDLLTTIPESWNDFDKEYCFKLQKSIPERIKAVMKVDERQLSINSYVFC